MQVNSAQDYLTMRKRQIIAATYNATPPPGARKNNAIFLSAIANNATQYERQVFPFQGATGSSDVSGNGDVSGGETYISRCCLSNGQAGAFGTFTTRTDKGVVRFNVIQPMGVRATTVTS
jgi:hypothetical protein